MTLCLRIPFFMKHNKYPHEETHLPSATFDPKVLGDASLNGADFEPSADEVARKAYFSYLNQGSLPGHDVQHWLEAEAELLEERNLTRAHGFHNRT